MRLSYSALKAGVAAGKKVLPTANRMTYSKLKTEAMIRGRAKANMSGFNSSAASNSAKNTGAASRVGTWLRNRPTWQKYAAGGAAGIVGARAIFGGRRDNGPSYYGY